MVRGGAGATPEGHGARWRPRGAPRSPDPGGSLAWDGLLPQPGGGEGAQGGARSPPRAQTPARARTAVTAEERLRRWQPRPHVHASGDSAGPALHLGPGASSPLR